MSSKDEEPEGRALKAVLRGHKSDYHWGTKMSIIFKRVRNTYKTNLLLFQLHYLQYASPVHGDEIGYKLAITGPITFIVCLGTPTLLGNINTNALCVHYQIAVMMLPLHYQLPLPLRG